MKIQLKGLQTFFVATLVLGMMLALTAPCLAEVVTANLSITPASCKRGDVLHFTGSVFYNAAANIPPGTTCYGGVSLDNADYPELNEWNSVQQVFKYPAQGQTTTINFTSTYTVPQALKGSTICFYVTEGQPVPRRISNKFCIMVKSTLLTRPPAMQKMKVTPPQ